MAPTPKLVECTTCHGWFKPQGLPSHQKACKRNSERQEVDTRYEERVEKEQREKEGIHYPFRGWIRWNKLICHRSPARNLAAHQLNLKPKPWEDLALRPKKRRAPPSTLPMRGTFILLIYEYQPCLMSYRICTN